MQFIRKMKLIMDRNEYNTAKEARTKSDSYVDKLAEFLNGDGKEYLIGEYKFIPCSFLDYLSVFSKSYQKS
jgi:hypothetical protein